MATPTLSRLRTSPIHLFLDFDGTLTKRDTLHFLGAIGFSHHRSQRLNQANDATMHESYLPGSQDAPLPGDPWAEVVQLYADDYKVHEAAYKPARSERSSVADEVAWLASLEEVENRSVRRVEGAGLFRGLAESEIDEGAKRVVEIGGLELREGWAEVLLGLRQPRLELENGASEDAPKNTENKISILSVNWSGRFVKTAMMQAASTTDARHGREKTELKRAVRDIEVIANEIEGLEDEGGSSGHLNKKGENGIRTSRDKSRELYRHSKPSGDRNGIEKADDPVVVYVGDSTTDFECLLEAGVGVCIRDDPMGSGQQELADAFERLGVRVQHVSALGEPSRDRPHEQTERMLWWAKDLKEVAGLFRTEHASRTFGASVKLGLQLLSGDMKALEEE